MTEPVIYFESEEGPALLDGSHLRSHFWTLCRYFVSEKFLTYCGVASSVTALNSLGISSPEVPQIYPFKMFTQDNFFSSDVLHIRHPSEVEKNGNTLDQLASMLAKLPVEVTARHAENLSVGQMRDLLTSVLEREDQRVIVDFDRHVVGQKGSGHFSPLAAYNQVADRFLLMDVARYKLPPSWLPTGLLYDAVQSVDPISGKARGFLILTRPAA